MKKSSSAVAGLVAVPFLCPLGGAQCPTELAQEAKLLPSSSTSGSMAVAVSLYDDTVAVTETGRTISDPGSLYIFRRDGTAWSLEQHCIFSSSQALQLPDSVSLYQSTCLAGARYALSGQLGVVYVFNRSGTVWTETQVITSPSMPSSHDEFGTSVAIEGTRAVIGATGHDLPYAETGAAYAYALQQDGQWAFDQKLSPSGAVGNEQFGTSVALHSGKTLVGALNGTGPGGAATGAAYQFNHQAGSWSQVAKYLASDAEQDSWYGASVSLSTDAFVGSPQDTNAIGSLAGSAYVYTVCP